jgi:GT2 family glycosyltransferase
MMAEIEKNWAACIVYYQDFDSLTNLLNSLESQTHKPNEVFIADNNSQRSLALGSFSFPVNIYRLDENKGFAGGANVAIRKAINKNFSNLMLLSQDVLLSPDSAQKLIEKLLITGGIVFPTMWDRNQNIIFSKGGKVNKFLGSIKLSTSNVPAKPDWADGSCLAFDKKTYESTGGIFEKYFMYFEDVDFCLNAKKLGFTLSHIDTKVSQTPKGPNSRLRSRNSVLLARRSKSWLFKISVTKRNVLGAFLNFAKFRLTDSKQRLIGIKEGWSVPIE